MLAIERGGQSRFLGLSEHDAPHSASSRFPTAPLPPRAGDGAGDGREAHISRALPVEAVRRYGDGMALALIIANKHRAGLEVAPGQASVPGKAVQQPEALPIKAAECPLLHMESNHSPQQVLAQSCRRRSSEHRPPAPPKGIDTERANVRDLG